MLPAVFRLQNRCSKSSFSWAAVPALGLAEPTAPPCVATGLRPPLLCGALSIGKPVTTRFGGCWWWWGCFCVGWILEWTCSAWFLVGSTVWRWKALDSYLLSCAASLSPGFLVFTIITLTKQIIICLLSSNVENGCWRVQDCKICFLAARKEMNENIAPIIASPDLFNASWKLNAYK